VIRAAYAYEQSCGIKRLRPEHGLKGKEKSRETAALKRRENL